MSEVYEVQDPNTGEHFALKLLIRSGSAIKRFNREYESISTLNHPSIVRVYRYGLHGSAPWIAMELLDGIALQVHAKRQGKPGTEKRTHEVIRMVWFMADALQYLHQRGMVHRDIKSANAMVLPDGRVKLLDFGTAHISDPNEAITRAREFVGTFAYASPEQIKSTTVDGRSDIYSLGVLLYRLLTGHRPFESSDNQALIQMHLTQPPKPPVEVIKDIPLPLNDLVLKMLAKEPDERPQDAESVALHLAALYGGTPSAAGDLVVRKDRAAGREISLRKILDTLLDPEGASVVQVYGAHGSARERVAERAEEMVSAIGWKTGSVRLGGRDDKRRLGRLFLEFCHDQNKSKKLRQLIDSAHRTEDGQRKLASAVCAAAGSCTDNEKSTLFVMRDLHMASPSTMGLLQRIESVILRSGNRCRMISISVESFSKSSSKQVMQITLDPLNANELSVAVGTMLHRRPLPMPIAREIYDVTGGHPRYIEETVTQLVEQGIICPSENAPDRLTWNKQPGIPLPTPGSLSSSVEQSLGSIPIAHRRALEALALLGGHPCIEDASAVLGWHPQSLREAVAEVGRHSGLITVNIEDPEFAQWASPVVPRVVLQSTSPLRQSWFSGELAKRIESGPVSLDQLGLIASGMSLQIALKKAIHVITTDKSPPSKVLAALQPLVRLIEEGVEPVESTDAGHILLKYAQCLLMLQPRHPDIPTLLARARANARYSSPHLSAKVLMVSADLHNSNGHIDAYRRTLRTAADAAQKADDMYLKANAIAKLSEIALQFGSVEGALENIEQIKVMHEDSKDKRIKVIYDLSCAQISYLKGDLNHAERLSKASLDASHSDRGSAATLQAAALLSQVLRQQGRFSEATNLLLSHLKSARTSEMPSRLIPILTSFGWCQLDLSRLGKVQEIVDEVDALVRESGVITDAVRAGLLRGSLHLAGGHDKRAIEDLKRLHKKASEASLHNLAAQVRGLFGLAHIKLGQVTRGEREIKRAINTLIECSDSIHIANLAAPLVVHNGPSAMPINHDIGLRGQLVIAISVAQWRHQSGQDDRAREATIEARELLERLGQQLTETDLATLRVHPWSHAINEIK